MYNQVIILNEIWFDDSIWEFQEIITAFGFIFPLQKVGSVR